MRDSGVPSIIVILEVSWKKYVWCVPRGVFIFLKFGFFFGHSLQSHWGCHFVGICMVWVSGIEVFLKNLG